MDPLWASSYMSPYFCGLRCLGYLASLRVPKLNSSSVFSLLQLLWPPLRLSYLFIYLFDYLRSSSLVAQMVKNPPAIWETWIQSLGWENPMEEGMTTHSSILAWRIPMDRGAWWVTVCGVTKSQT